MRRIGFSTGALAYGDFKKAIIILKDSSANAIELSALRRDELDPLVSLLNELDLSRYSYISVHAPSKFTVDDEPKVIQLLETFANRNWPIIVHPDAIKIFERWRVFGSLLLIENMDSCKSIGKTYAELEEIFKHLPEARFCFDIAHAWQYDRTMQEAVLMLENFKSRIAQIHISGIENKIHKHTYMSRSTIKDYMSVSNLIPKGVSVIVESVIEPTNIEVEMRSAKLSLKQKEPTYARCKSHRNVVTRVELH